MARQSVLFVSPAAAPSPEGSWARFASRLAGWADIAVQPLEIWRRDPDAAYDIHVEVDGVARAARAAGFRQYHVFGFSAGATVALAAAMSFGDAVASVAVLEPATIGDDDWHPVEAGWREALRAIWALPPDLQTGAFRALLMRPGLAPPAPVNPTAEWGRRGEMLEDMLARTGFRSDDLARIRAPVLVVTGGRSHPRFGLLADRVVAIAPNAEAVLFPECSHFSPPFREEPDRFAGVLARFWGDAGM